MFKSPLHRWLFILLILFVMIPSLTLTNDFITHRQQTDYRAKVNSARTAASNAAKKDWQRSIGTIISTELFEPDGSAVTRPVSSSQQGDLTDHIVFRYTDFFGQPKQGERQLVGASLETGQNISLWVSRRGEYRVMETHSADANPITDPEFQRPLRATYINSRVHLMGSLVLILVFLFVALVVGSGQSRVSKAEGSDLIPNHNP